MTALVPIGYVTVLQAAEMLLPAMYAGTPDRPLVTSLRQKGVAVTDGPAKDDAIARLWSAVDDGEVTPMAVVGPRRGVIKLDPDLTKIPVLRDPRGRGFTYLRPSNPAFSELAAYCGGDLSNVSVVFRESEIQRLARNLMRARRASSRSQGQKRRGRPSRQEVVLSTVQGIVEQGDFLPLNGLKALTQSVNKKGKFKPPVSDETVDRVLDGLYQQTKDRRFQRIRRKRRQMPRDNQVERRGTRQDSI
jgi:hypothetical protein